MRSKEEMKALQDHLLRLLPIVEAELMQIPGVVGVGIGYKETAGELTNDVSFRVYVREKKPEILLSPAERIPQTTHGIKTDVLVIQQTETLVDDSKYRPVKGGVQIGNGTGSLGTLGCLAKRNSDGAWVILSNHHVMLAGGKTLADHVKIGQPDYSSCCCCSCGEIGEVVNASIGGLVDCAIAVLKTDVSFVNDIAQIGPVRGKATAVLGDTVQKIGRTTGLTRGAVVDINYLTTSNQGNSFTNQIRINPSAGIPKFSDRGDSGSAIVDSDDKIVGLLWGGVAGPGVASHIANVENAMGISIQATSGVSTYIAREPTHVSIANLIPSELSELNSIVGLEWPDHHPAAVVIERHQAEVIRLINHNRAVMTTWQRKQGPAFVAAFMRNRREPSYTVPEAIHGISMISLLMSMYVVLDENGSELLRRDIKLYGLETLEQLRTCNSYVGLVRKLHRMGHSMMEFGPQPLNV